MKRATREEMKKINKFLDSKDKEEADEKFAWESRTWFNYQIILLSLYPLFSKKVFLSC